MLNLIHVQSTGTKLIRDSVSDDTVLAHVVHAMLIRLSYVRKLKEERYTAQPLGTVLIQMTAQFNEAFWTARRDQYVLIAGERDPEDQSHRLIPVMVVDVSQREDEELTSHVDLGDLAKLTQPAEPVDDPDSRF